MKCMEARALKSKQLRELGMTSNQQAFLGNFCCFNGASGVSSDDFSVDRFLDFSTGEFDDGGSAEEEEEKDYLSVSSQDNNSNSAGYSFNYLLPDELSVPDDDVAGLEWVSQLVDDSLSEIPLLYPFSKQKTDCHAKPDPKPASVKPACFLFRLPVKARTKRPRTARRDLSTLLVFLTESSSSCSSNSEPPMKKPKKKQAALIGGLLGGNTVQRRCTHCQVLKTPQWRTGPLGAKTLCNACGVRYKSDRLFPEYRPACSPTFLADIHSNSHRKVLEIRKRKEMELALVGVEPGLNLVHNF